MNDQFAFAAHNTVVALVMTLFVFLLTRRRRNPPLAHVLWLLVLIKLVAPPVVCFEWSELPPFEAPAGQTQTMVNRSQFAGRAGEESPEIHAGTIGQPIPASGMTFEHASRALRFWDRALIVLIWLWVGGAGLCTLVAATRIVRFERLLKDTLPASKAVQHLTLEVAAKLGVRSTPTVHYVESAQVPFLWCAGRRPTIVLPLNLLRRFDDQRLALILAHELAHLRRRDHWVRVVELFVSTVYWWNPLVWFIRRQLHEAEDLCCDAWVRSVFPDCTKRYAEVLLETAESLGARQVRARLLPASPFLRSVSLKARIEMILERKFAPRLSARSAFVVALFATLLIPSFIPAAKTDARAGSDDDAPAAAAARPEGSTTSEFPYSVRFEQGKTEFSAGDAITITEIRGTAETFAPGNIYWIKGNYVLTSHDGAMMAAFVSAMDAANGRGPYLKVQTTQLERGHGSFTLFLPMSYRGWPHVSFYPAKGGSVFGGTYFGTADSVLKQPEGSGQTQQKERGESALTSVHKQAPSAKKADATRAAKFPYVVHFEQGATKFLDGDKITITEVRGTADRFAPGNAYQIKGTYTLASHDGATLAAYITAMDADSGKGSSSNTQAVVIDRGNGTFTLVLPMNGRGWPHVSFYPADGGDGFGGNYFGTGDSVMKE
jgi:beta-lactamase regulating signal transducer with metallopeptidase domain